MCLAIKESSWPNPALFDYYQMQKPFSEFTEKVKDKWNDWILSDEVFFSAHNAFFEQCMYDNVLVRRFGWPTIPIHKWRCSAAKAAAVAIPRNLAGAGAVMKLPVQKDYDGYRVMMKLCKPTAAWVKWNKLHQKKAAWTRKENKEIKATEEPMKFWTPQTAPDDFKTLYHYCKTDIIAEEGLDDALPDLTPKEQKLWFLDQKINLSGVQVDMPLVNKIAGIMEVEARTMTKELDVLTMGLVSSGNKRVAILDFLTIEGIEMPDLKAATVDEFLTNGKATGDAEKILKIRRALSKSSTAKYHTFQRRAKTDGRVRDLTLYCGASTGRWAGVGIQPQNFPRGVVKDIHEAIERIKTCDVDTLKLLYGANLMPLFSSVLRGMFIASDGCDLFVEDYNTIELRVLWWLAGNEKGLDKLRNNLDPYKIRMAQLLNKPISEITPDERQTGKAIELGSGFGMGPAKLVTSAWDIYRARISLKLARVAIPSYRKDNWQVVELWANYNDACLAATENPHQKYQVGKVKFYMERRFLKIELPSGRKLAYCEPRVNFQTVIKLIQKDGEIAYTSSKQMLHKHLKDGAKVVGKFKTRQLSYMAINMKAKKEDCVIPKWVRERTYGGKITENIVQAVARDVLAESITRVNKAGFNVLMHSHDELVCEAPKGKFESKDYRKVMETLPEWATGLPLKSGGWCGPRYHK
jgi:DNA polymerase